MRALIFAAGLGERMRPLTDRTPKPLLHVGGKPLIVWHLEKLAARGVRDVVVNTSWLADQFPQTLGDGSTWGLNIRYSYEGTVPLETGGGMLHALPLLGDALHTNEAFLLVNGDVWSDYDFAQLPTDPMGDAHLVMVDRPPQATHGDFAMDEDGFVRSEGANPLTYSGIGMYRARLFDNWRTQVSDACASETPPRFRLAPLLRAAMGRDAVTGEHYRGRWTDVGTPERLVRLDLDLS